MNDSGAEYVNSLQRTRTKQYEYTIKDCFICLFSRASLPQLLKYPEHVVARTTPAKRNFQTHPLLRAR